MRIFVLIALNRDLHYSFVLPMYLRTNQQKLCDHKPNPNPNPNTDPNHYPKTFPNHILIYNPETYFIHKMLRIVEVQKFRSTQVKKI